MPLSFSNHKINSHKSGHIAIEDDFEATDYFRENRIDKKLIDKYVFLKINGKGRFFKIVKIHGNKNYTNAQQNVDFFMHDSMVCGIVNEGEKMVPIFDLRTNKNLTDDNIKPDKYIQVTIEDYEKNIDIGIVYKNINDIINIPSQYNMPQ